MKRPFYSKEGGCVVSAAFGDRVECRVTGWGEAACPGHTDPEMGGVTHMVSSSNMSRGGREMSPRSAFLCHVCLGSFLELKDCLGVPLWHGVRHIALRCAAPSPWCSPFPKTPMIEKTIWVSRNGKYSAISPQPSTPLPMADITNRS